MEKVLLLSARPRMAHVGGFELCRRFLVRVASKARRPHAPRARRPSQAVLLAGAPEIRSAPRGGEVSACSAGRTYSWSCRRTAVSIAAGGRLCNPVLPGRPDPMPDSYQLTGNRD